MYCPVSPAGGIIKKEEVPFLKVLPLFYSMECVVFTSYQAFLRPFLQALQVLLLSSLQPIHIP